MKAPRLFWTVCLALLVMGCGDQITEPKVDPDPGGDPPPETVTASASLVNEVAADFYTNVAEGSELATEINDILGALIRVAPVEQEGKIRGALEEGEPIALDAQVQILARAFDQGMMLDLNSFFAAAAKAGATVEGTGEPLTRAYLTQELMPLLDQDTFTTEDILPAVVLALGRERARRSEAGITDPVWGDEWLDPLQATLLFYAIHFSGHDSPAASAYMAPPAHSTRQPSGSDAAADEKKLPDFLNPKEKGRDLVTGWIANLIDFPLGPDESAKQVLCASVILYSYKMDVSSSELDLYHRQHDNSALPYYTRLDASLEFDFETNFVGEDLLKLTCGELPESGPAAGTQVTWTIDEDLEAHGDLTPWGETADPDGRAIAKYQTIDEIVPQPFRVDLDVVAGLVSAEATGLLADWGGLEAVWRKVRANRPGEDAVALSVSFYRPPALEFSFDSRIEAMSDDGEDHYQARTTAVGFLLEKRVIRNAEGEDSLVYYIGSGETSFEASWVLDGCPAILESWQPTPGADGVLGTQAGVVFDGGTEPLRVYLNPSRIEETWKLFDKDDGGCELVETKTSPLAWGLYAGLHLQYGEGDNTPYQVGDSRFFFETRGWEATRRSLRKVYEYTDPSTGIGEQTTLVLRVISP